MARFRPEPEESPALIPPPRLPPTAVGLAVLPPAIPPGGRPKSRPARPAIRALLTVAGSGFVVGAIALTELSLLLIPVSIVVGWLGAEVVVAGITGRRHFFLARLD
jgi:hypothetical protein